MLHVLLTVSVQLLTIKMSKQNKDLVFVSHWTKPACRQITSTACQIIFLLKYLKMMQPLHGNSNISELGLAPSIIAMLLSPFFFKYCFAYFWIKPSRIWGLVVKSSHSSGNNYTESPAVSWSLSPFLMHQRSSSFLLLWLFP